MKNTLLASFVILLCSTLTFAGAPPAEVQKTFTSKFPTASKISWGKENATEWEAKFTMDGNKISANFSANGSWVETEKEIPVSQLPKAVAEAIQKQYPGWKITEADKTETAKNGTIYEADLKSGNMKKSLAFKADGTTVVE
ncbi:MAG: PepSY-like domain-containing protein [Bacteroidetes bacterium]|nr:PepSY-like domain-containing protein [Bacteroidota bacterium]